MLDHARTLTVCCTLVGVLAPCFSFLLVSSMSLAMPCCLDVWPVLLADQTGGSVGPTWAVYCWRPCGYSWRPCGPVPLYCRPLGYVLMYWRQLVAHWQYCTMYCMYCGCWQLVICHLALLVVPGPHVCLLGRHVDVPGRLVTLVMNTVC